MHQEAENLIRPVNSHLFPDLARFNMDTLSSPLKYHSSSFWSSWTARKIRHKHLHRKDPNLHECKAKFSSSLSCFRQPLFRAGLTSFTWNFVLTKNRLQRKRSLRKPVWTSHWGVEISPFLYVWMAGVTASDDLPVWNRLLAPQKSSHEFLGSDDLPTNVTQGNHLTRWHQREVGDIAVTSVSGMTKQGVKKVYVQHKHRVARISLEIVFRAKRGTIIPKEIRATRCLWYLNNMDCNHAIVWSFERWEFSIDHLEASWINCNWIMWSLKVWSQGKVNYLGMVLFVENFSREQKK